jgi:hypothetical protein
MDGDATGKTFDKGANSAIRNAEGSDGIHESSHQAVHFPLVLPSGNTLTFPVSHLSLSFEISLKFGNQSWIYWNRIP